MERILHANGRNATSSELAQVPTEGKWFKVNPLSIDQNLFKDKRADQKQEETRQLILEAFEEMKKDSKYGKPFKTMFPKKTWDHKTEVELAELASKLGDHNADWLEHALEWAQRIANGETWESICNEPDTANWFRLVKWKNGYYNCKIIGGSREQNDDAPASNVYDRDYCEAFNHFLYTVPLIVSYED